MPESTTTRWQFVRGVAALLVVLDLEPAVPSDGGPLELLGLLLGEQVQVAKRVLQRDAA